MELLTRHDTVLASGEAKELFVEHTRSVGGDLPKAEIGIAATRRCGLTVSVSGDHQRVVEIGKVARRQCGVMVSVLGRAGVS
jgi:hypothetical protein